MATENSPQTSTVTQTQSAGESFSKWISEICVKFTADEVKAFEHGFAKIIDNIRKRMQHTLMIKLNMMFNKEQDKCAYIQFTSVNVNDGSKFTIASFNIKADVRKYYINESYKIGCLINGLNIAYAAPKDKWQDGLEDQMLFAIHIPFFVINYIYTEKPHIRKNPVIAEEQTADQPTASGEPQAKKRKSY